MIIWCILHAPLMTHWWIWLKMFPQDAGQSLDNGHESRAEACSWNSGCSWGDVRQTGAVDSSSSEDLTTRKSVGPCHSVAFCHWIGWRVHGVQHSSHSSRSWFAGWTSFMFSHDWPSSPLSPYLVSIISADVFYPISSSQWAQDLMSATRPSCSAYETWPMRRWRGPISERSNGWCGRLRWSWKPCPFRSSWAIPMMVGLVDDGWSDGLSREVLSLSDLQFIGVATAGMAGAASVVLGAPEQHTSTLRPGKSRAIRACCLNWRWTPTTAFSIRVSHTCRTLYQLKTVVGWCLPFVGFFL